MTADVTVPARKKVHMPGSLVGRSLGECGPVLRQLLLEVLPLCSQSMGRMGPRSLFPLPTSRNIMVACFPDLSDDERSWLLCETMSLNSLWGEEFFSDRMPTQHCSKNVLGRVSSGCSSFMFNFRCH